MDILTRMAEKLRTMSENDVINTNTKFDVSLVKDLINLLIHKENKITFYEIEKSQIIKHLAKYLDSNFNISEVSDDVLCFPGTFIKVTSNVIKKDMCGVMRNFLKSFNNNNENIEQFIKILQSSIRSMNCFKLFLQDKPNYKTSPQFYLSGNFNN